MFRNLGSAVLVMALVLGLAGTLSAAPYNSVFRPADYTSIDLGGNSDLNVSSGTVSINTGTGSGAAPTITIGGTEYSGVYAVNANSTVRMAVFTFDSVSVASGVTFDVTGNLGVVLASKDTFGFGGTISVSGKSTSSSTGGAGGPGAEGGNRTSSLSSNPPPANAGDGST
jgi:hypothetical protein